MENLREALLLMAERTPFRSDKEKDDVIATITSAEFGNCALSPAETQSDSTPSSAPRKTAPRKATRTRAR